MRSIGVICFLFVALSAGASADIIATASNGSQMEDSAFWASLANAGSQTPVSGSVSSLNGVTVTPNSPTEGELYLLTGDAWGGQLPSGDQLLSSGAQAPGAIIVDFALPVSGAGFLAQQANFADSGVFSISALGAGNTLLGSTSVAAASGNDVFVGLVDNTGADIYSVSVNFSDTSNSGGSGNFAIDTLLLADAQQSPAGGGLMTSNLGPRPTPEPASILLCGAALAGWGFFRRRRVS